MRYALLRSAVAHLLALVAPTLAIVVSHLLTRRKLRVIHDQTNSRLTETLQQLDEARAQLRCDRCPHLPEVLRRPRPRRKLSAKTRTSLAPPPTLWPMNNEDLDAIRRNL
jgi:hypothetical protein